MQYKKLEPEFKQKWMEALKSGQYEQGKDYLYTEGRDGKPEYCCLGVAEAICGTPINTMHQEGDPRELHDEDGKVVSEIAHMVDSQAMDRLMELNDGKGAINNPDHTRRHSFEEIALWINENL